jgi:hypothetical protein
MLFLMLVFKTSPAVAQAVSPDSQMAQTLLMEIRALRLDLRDTAAIIQRVQLVMYRLQAQAALVDKAEQRLDQARGQCKLAQDQQKFTATQIEQVRKQNANNGADQKAAEQMISQFQAAMETWAGQGQQCQVEQIDAETQFRAEQAKMNALEDQLVQLDQGLAGHDRK